MKEFHNLKNKKRKPGDFQKAYQKHLKIQHNRDQLKLLKDNKVSEADIFILQSTSHGSVLKQITIRMPSEYEPNGGQEVVYLSHGKGHQSRLALGHYAEKYNSITDQYTGINRVNLNDLVAIVIDCKVLKEYKNNKK